MASIETIRLVCADAAAGTAITIPVGVAAMSQMLKNLLEDITDRSAPIPIPNVTVAIAEIVIDFMTQMTQHPERTNFALRDMSQVVQWQNDFIARYHVPLLFSIVVAANYFDIEQLAGLTALAIARGMHGMTVEQMRDYLQVKETGFTPEQIKEMQEEDAWIHEFEGK